MSTQQTTESKVQGIRDDFEAIEAQIKEILANIDGDLSEVQQASEAVQAARKAYIEAQVARHAAVCKGIQKAIEDEKLGKKSSWLQQQADKEATLGFIKGVNLGIFLEEVLNDVENQVTALYGPGQIGEPVESILGRPDGSRCGLDALGIAVLFSQISFTKHSILSDADKIKQAKDLIDAHLAFCLVDAIQPATTGAVFLNNLPQEKAVAINRQVLQSPQTANNNAILAKILSSQFNQAVALVLAESEDQPEDSETDSE